LAEKTIEENRGMKVLGRKMTDSRKEIFKLCDKTGVVSSNRSEILDIAREFYRDLYTSVAPPPLGSDEQHRPKIRNIGSELLPTINIEEIKTALQKMKNGKAPGEDGILIESIKEGGDTLLQAISALFSKCLEESKIPDSWNNAVVVLLHKKGDITRLENYRPISLLSQLYKLFTKVITTRLTNRLDFYQPVEQAGFRSGYGTNDHLQTMRLLIEKHNEYKKNIAIAFVDYEKAFDSVEMWAILNALDECRTDSRYSKILKYIYEHATSSIRLHEDTQKFSIDRGVRQGDTISPKLFTAALESIFKKLEWSELGVNINGRYLNHLRFADDIVLIAPDLQQLKLMLTELNEESKKVGLKMNWSKTKYMTNIPTDTNIKIQNQEVELVDEYKYLGHTLRLGYENQKNEISRRIGLTWAAFGKLKFIFRSNMDIRLKTKVYEQCVLPVMTYGSETLTLTKASTNKLRVSQRAMERAMLGISLRDKKRNEWIRRKTGVTDVIHRIRSLKWQWAGHIARMDDKRWTKCVLDWRPYDRTRPIGRPPERWDDDIKRYLMRTGQTTNKNWQKLAKNRETWKNLKEAFLQFGD